MHTFDSLVYVWMAIGIITFITLVTTKIRAPYGRHVSEKWGKMIDNRLGWIIMEFPALTIFPLIVIFGRNEKNWFIWLLVGLWLLHYVNRTLIFPFRLKTRGKKMPLTIVLSAIGFNTVNGILNGYFLGFIYEPDSVISIFDLNIVIGVTVFVSGYIINQTADNKLIGLRKENNGYQIPRGGLFKYISCPNHFGEIVEWTGFAIIACNLPALSFAIWTFCNLAPRAMNHHAWYIEKFEAYPEKRKAVIPFIL